MELELFEDNTRQQFFRFSEIIDLIEKKDGRRQLTFEDQGYVSDPDLFLTGCISCMTMSMFIAIDGADLNWKLLVGHQKLKTLIDFYQGKIACQGKLISELPGYVPWKIRDREIRAYVINPGSSTPQLVEFLKLM